MGRATQGEAAVVFKSCTTEACLHGEATEAAAVHRSYTAWDLVPTCVITRIACHRCSYEMAIIIIAALEPLSLSVLPTVSVLTHTVSASQKGKLW